MSADLITAFESLFSSSVSSSSLSSSSSDFGALEWAVFGVFVALLVICVALFVFVLITRKKISFALLVLILGWIMRCPAMLWDLPGNAFNNAAGLFFFTASCITVAELLRSYHEQRDCPGSVYRSVKMMFIGYNTFFYLLSVCATAIFLITSKTSNQDAFQPLSLVLNSILDILFGISFVFLGAACCIMFYVLRHTLKFIKLIIPFYICFLGCLFFRGIIDIFCGIDEADAQDWFDSRINNNVAGLISEALPGAMMMIIVYLTRSPWDGPYMPLGKLSRNPEMADSLTVSDIFQDPEIDVIDRRMVRQLDVISTGSNATVYKSTFNKNTVAVKIFHLALKEMTKGQVASVAREIKLMASLQHPNIVTMHGVILTSEEQLGIVTEYVELGSLNNVLAQMHRDMLWSVRLRMALDVARGMSFLHSNNVLHRDLKNANVMVTKTLQCKIGDLGLAQFIGLDSSSQPVVGTLEYIAPEVLAGGKYTFQADVYSFGVVLYGLANGRAPYTECSLPADEMCSAIISGRLAIRLSPRCPKQVADIIMSCTSHDPNSRPSFVDIERRIEALRSTSFTLPE